MPDRSSATKPKGLFYLQPLAAVLVAVTTAFSLAISDTILRGVLISATAAALALPILARGPKHSSDIFEPIFPASIYLAIMFVMRPLADQATHKYIQIGYNFSGSFDYTLLVTLVGCAAFSVGYIAPLANTIGKRLPPIPTNLTPKRSFRLALLFATLGVGIFLQFILRNGGLSTLRLFFVGRSLELGQMLRSATGYEYTSINLLIPASFIFFSCWFWNRRPRYLLATLLCLGPFLWLQIVEGNRIFVVPTVFGMAIVYYLGRNTRPSGKLLVFAFVAIPPLLATLRETRSIESATSAPTTLAAAVTESFSADDNEMFDSLSLVTQAFPDQLPYQPLGLFSDVGSRLLPRTLFPNKPLETNDLFISTMWPWHYRQSKAGTACSLWGAFYMYGGITGVALGAFLTGICLRSSWNWLRRQNGDRMAIVIYAIIPGLTIVLLRGTVQDTLAYCFFTVFPPILAAAYWSFGTRPNPVRNRRPTVAAPRSLQLNRNLPWR